LHVTADDTAFASMKRFLPISRTGRIGLSFAMDVETVIDSVSVRLRYFTTVGCYDATIAWDYNTRELIYKDSDGNPVLLGTHEYFPDDIALFVQGKLVVDFDRKEYVSLAIDQYNSLIFVGLSTWSLL